MSKRVYLDSAATTCLLPEVIDEMVQVLQNDYGNPSSTHSFGRSSKTLVESSRKSIAKHLNCSSSELIFTSSGTEATNWILNNAVKYNGIKRIISSKIEHHATLYTVLALQKEYNIQLDFVNILSTGSIDYNHLSELLNQEIPTLVSLMHVNNEIGTQLDVSKVGKLCKEHNALFHCDTVQSIGKSKIDLELLPVDFLVASAHKFHGPKGIGFAYVRKGIVMQPMTYGGAQEKGLRAGTEAVHQIAGMAKAFDLGHENLEKDIAYISDLKNYCVEQLLANFPDIRIVGENTFYNIINFILPFSEAKTAI
jgi:cysteine desulfurase